jgi:predicted peptidase
VCGFVAERQAVMHPMVYPAIVPGATDPSAAVAHRVAHIPTWIFHGDADSTVPVEHSRHMAAVLRSLNAPIQYTELRGVGHNAWDYTYERPEVASWLLQQRLGAGAPIIN